MSIWRRYTVEQRKEYIQFLQVYGALSNLFRQKKGDLIPYLDSKFQETIFARVFNGQNVDIGNTPHDILSVFGNERIGIGLKTWMNSRPSYQKVMQLKRYQDEINNSFKNGYDSLAFKISEIRNERIKSDYERLGLSEDKNIYHYVTRDKNMFVINECSYPLIDVNNLRDFEYSKTAFNWTDGNKEYKFTFGDSQIWMKFGSSLNNSQILESFKVEIINDPFEFLLNAYLNLIDSPKETDQEIEEAYLPLYSYKLKEVGEKSGLNAWNSAPKNKDSFIPRPLNEVYIPIPKDFHYKHKDFFNPNILKVIEDRELYKNDKRNRPEVRFHIILPNGKRLPALITGDNMKNFQTGSLTERDEHGVLYGQSALGQWLLVDVLGLKERKIVTRDWLNKKGTDSVRIWKKKGDYSTFYIDFAPTGSFEAFMKNEPLPTEDDLL